MKLLLFSDLHCDAEAARRLVGTSREADVVVCAGDLANVRRGIHVCVDVLKEIDRPTVLIAGNNETTDELNLVCKDWPQATVLHGTQVEIGGVVFFGLGGGVPVTPFGPWSYDFTEEQARALLDDCPPGCVLVSHSPPRGCVDVSSSGRSLGSEAVRETIVRVAPSLVVCGHIHASAGQRATLGKTTVINAGPDGIWWEWKG